MLKTGVTKYGLVSGDFIQDHLILFNFRNLKTDPQIALKYFLFHYAFVREWKKEEDPKRFFGIENLPSLN